MRFNKIEDGMPFPGGTFNNLVEMMQIATRPGNADGVVGDVTNVKHSLDVVGGIQIARLRENVTAVCVSEGFYSNDPSEHSHHEYNWYQRKAGRMEISAAYNDIEHYPFDGQYNRLYPPVAPYLYEIDPEPDDKRGKYPDGQAGEVLLTNLSPMHSYCRGAVVYYMQFQGGLNVILPEEGQIAAVVITRASNSKYSYTINQGTRYEKTITPVWEGCKCAWNCTPIQDGDVLPSQSPWFDPFWYGPNPNENFRGVIGHRADVLGGTENSLNGLSYTPGRDRYMYGTDWEYADADFHAEEILVVDHLGIFHDQITQYMASATPLSGFAVPRPVYNGRMSDDTDQHMQRVHQVVYELIQLGCDGTLVKRNPDERE